MRLLAIETATAIGSVALWEGGRLLVRSLGAERDHGRSLAPAVAALLEASSGNLDGYAIAIGPGSFTGLRVGLAFLKGLALAQPRPVLAVSTLELMVEAAKQSGARGPVAAVLDARNGEVFARATGGLLAEGLYPASAVGAALAAQPEGDLVGDALPSLEAALPQWRSLGRPRVLLAEILAGLAAIRWPLGSRSDLQSLEPSYLQPPAAERKRSVTDPTPR